MNQEKQKSLIICTTVLVETSPQAIPLGAACVASALKADARLSRFDVALLDFSLEDDDVQNAQKNGGEDECAAMIGARLAKKCPTAVCFSVYVWNHTLLEKVAAKLKNILPDCVCIAGGPEVTADPTNFRFFDFTVAGQGEIAVPELCAKLFDSNENRDFSIPGVFSKNSQENSIQRATPCKMENAPSPYLDGTLDVEKYGGALWELARGCPFKCSYCYESKGEQKIAYFPLERLKKEIELFAQKKIAQVFVLDPTYNANKKRALKMLHIIEEKTSKMFFYFEARAEFIDRELAKAFAKIPCCLQIGLQSANPDVLKNVHRTLNKKLFTKNIGFLNDEGVIFGFDLIFGLPGDTLKGFRSSIDFALSLYPNNLELFCLSVLPGTKLHDDAPKFNLEWQKNPPYHVIKTPTFSQTDIARALRLAKATNIFYNDGRAVPWFNSILRVLKENASRFLEDFADFLEKIQIEELDSEKIEKIQKDFVKEKFHEKKIDRLFLVANDLISIHGALGRCTADGTKSTFFVNYYPDDLLSVYATDIAFFSSHAQKKRYKVNVFFGKNGVDWKIL